MGTTIHEDGSSRNTIRKRVQAGWNSWRKVTGVMCDKKISAKSKGNVYKAVVRPAILYGLETSAMTKKQDKELEVAEM